MKRRNWALLFVAAVLVACTEATFVTLLDPPWNAIRPVLVGCVLCVVLNRPKGALAFALLAGFVADIFAIGPGTFAMARFTVIAASLIGLSLTVLTNRSVYATALLMVFARLADRLWLLVVSWLNDALLQKVVMLDTWQTFMTTLLWDAFFASLGFISLALFTRRFFITVPRGFARYDEH